jgi:hypothetical protein
MKPTLARLYELIFATLIPAGRERARRIHEAETDALVAACRMRMLRQLTCIGEYQLAIADIARRQATAEQPDVRPHAQTVLDALSEAIAREIADYAHGRRGLPR